MREAVCLGDNCIDRYVEPIQRDFVGGQAVNVAAQLRSFGMRVHYAGVVGMDQAGDLILKEMTSRGVDVSLVTRALGATGLTTVTNKTGERLFLAEQYGVSAPYHPTPEAVQRARQVNLVFAAHVNDLASFASALPAGPLLAVDWAEDELSERVPKRVDVLFISRPDLANEEAKREAEKIVDAGTGIVVVTRGAAGALAVRADAVARVPAAPTEVVDTLGAGDAFAAAFLASLVEVPDLERALRWGASAGAAACRHYGSLPVAP